MPEEDARALRFIPKLIQIIIRGMGAKVAKLKHVAHRGPWGGPRMVMPNLRQLRNRVTSGERVPPGALVF